MSDKQTIFLAIDDDELLTELKSLINLDKYTIKSYKTESECNDNLHLKPDIIFIDFLLNNQKDTKEKRSVEVIEKIKENKLGTRIFMFSDKESAKFYLSILDE